MNKPLKFVLAGEIREISACAPTLTVLEYLRRSEGLTGAKEGCAEGDCGACTVVLGAQVAGVMRYRAVNACIQFLPSLYGKWLITVEDLRRFAGGGLHPVQQAMIDRHGSQCGFCTPGFIMSMFALFRQGKKPNRQMINDALAGNLCRCTGYGAIVEAVFDMFALQTETAFDAEEQAVSALLKTLETRETTGVSMAGSCFYAPASLKALAALYADQPTATLLAGGTDVGLQVTKWHRDMGNIIYTGRVAELLQIKKTDRGLEIGAAVTHGDAMQALAQFYPDMGELLRRFASPQIRNVGTLGGNIANGSPIGDMPPALIAINACLVLRHNDTQREIALEDFFVEYGRQDRAAGEIVEKIIVPAPEAGNYYRNYKISKRFDQDISAVCAAFNLRIEQGRISGARVVFGGMAGIPCRARKCEAALIGRNWVQKTVDLAIQALSHDYAPMTDMRASAEYRMTVAQNLLQKFYLETSGKTPTRLVGHKGPAHA